MESPYGAGYGDLELESYGRALLHDLNRIRPDARGG
jgi:hypothetical protein